MNDTMLPPDSDPSALSPAGADAPSSNPRVSDHLDELIGRLEIAADQLRSGDLSTDAAATLVEECAVLANRAGAELERRTHAPARGQGTLL